MPCPRRLFLLWSQGWNTAPQLVRRTLQSWTLHNPDWQIVLLDRNNLSQWMDTDSLCHPNMTVQAASDVIRLSLLAKHGGVWADATMLCIRPLDGWIDAAVSPEGFWMYHGRDGARGPASWFMASLAGAKIVSRWLDACTAYWAFPSGQTEYYWMDRLFSRLAQSDDDFLASWRRVPFLDCNARGSAHCMAGRVFDAFDPALLRQIQETLPFALKLSWSGSLAPSTNAWNAIDWALTPRHPTDVAWQEAPSLAYADFFSAKFPRQIFLNCEATDRGKLKKILDVTKTNRKWIIHNFVADTAQSPDDRPVCAAEAFTIVHKARVWPQDDPAAHRSKPYVADCVRRIDFSKFLLDRIAADDRAVLRMDLAGKEYDVLNHMLQTDALLRIDILYVKFYPRPQDTPQTYKRRRKDILARIRKKHPTLRFATRQFWFVCLVLFENTFAKPWHKRKPRTPA